MTEHLTPQPAGRPAAKPAKPLNLRLTICGIGALGSNLADTLARQGFSNLRVIDHDRVEAHNIATQIYDQPDIGQPKADALRNRLFRAAGVEIDAVRKELTAANAHTLLKDSELIVDCFDNTAARQCVQDHARKTNTPTLHAGLFPDYGEIIWDAQYKVPRNVAGAICNYPLARNLILLTVAVTAQTILQYRSTAAQNNWTITLADLAIKPL